MQKMRSASKVLEEVLRGSTPKNAQERYFPTGHSCVLASELIVNHILHPITILLCGLDQHQYLGYSGDDSYLDVWSQQAIGTTPTVAVSTFYIFTFEKASVVLSWIVLSPK